MTILLLVYARIVKQQRNTRMRNLMRVALFALIAVGYTSPSFGADKPENGFSVQNGIAGTVITVTGTKPAANATCAIQSYVSDGKLNGSNKYVRGLSGEKGCPPDIRVLSAMCSMIEHIDSALHYVDTDVVKFALRGNKTYSEAERVELAKKIARIYAGPIVRNKCYERTRENLLATQTGWSFLCAIILSMRNRTGGLVHEHKRTAVASYFKEIIYGGIDGIITTFAIVAGFSGAALTNDATTQLSFLIVLLFGLANLFADAVSMGLGNFLSVRSDKSLYVSVRGKELQEIKEHPDTEAEETVRVLVRSGFSEEHARVLTDIYRTNETYWADFIMTHELEMPDPTDENPLKTGLATFLSFVCFGFIPLMPFIFLGSYAPQTVFEFSTAGAFAALILLGVLKWQVVHTSLVKSVCEVVLIGGVAAMIAFFVGSFFSL